MVRILSPSPVLRTATTGLRLNYFCLDISLRNVAYTSSYLGHASEDELFEQLGQPETEDLIRKDGEALGSNLPAQFVKSTNWNEFPDDRDAEDVDVRLIDLGEAFAYDAVPERLAQPPELRAPEVVFTGKFDYRVDLWCTGLTVSRCHSKEKCKDMLIPDQALPPDTRLSTHALERPGGSRWTHD